jgi:hypothetical protein
VAAIPFRHDIHVKHCGGFIAEQFSLHDAAKPGVG